MIDIFDRKQGMAWEYHGILTNDSSVYINANQSRICARQETTISVCLRQSLGAFETNTAKRFIIYQTRGA